MILFLCLNNLILFMVREIFKVYGSLIIEQNSSSLREIYAAFFVSFIRFYCKIEIELNFSCWKL